MSLVGIFDRKCHKCLPMKLVSNMYNNAAPVLKSGPCSNNIVNSGTVTYETNLILK